MPRSVLPALFLLATAYAQTPEPGAITWHTDFATARALARQTGAPLLVTFRCEA